MSHTLSYKIEGMKPTKILVFHGGEGYAIGGTVPAGKVWQIVAVGTNITINDEQLYFHDSNTYYNGVGYFFAGEGMTAALEGYNNAHMTCYEYPAATQSASADGTEDGFTFTPEYGY